MKYGRNYGSVKFYNVLEKWVSLLKYNPNYGSVIFFIILAPGGQPLIFVTPCPKIIFFFTDFTSIKKILLHGS